MSAPTVCAVMLANGRPEMVKRAVAGFRAQTYEAKHLLLYDTTEDRINDLCDLVGISMDDEDVTIRESNALNHHGNRKTIGHLRNRANHNASFADIILHFDSDDWSHPNRIAEQVALLRSSGAECVGYNEMLFWCTLPQFSKDAMQPGNPSAGVKIVNEGAWLYRASVPNYAIGTSMCYWRSTWERNPFADRSEGCDDLDWFNRGVKIESVEAFQPDDPPMFGETCFPLMIASIHGGNTCSRIDATKREWQRVPEWDEYCRNAMRLS